MAIDFIPSEHIDLGQWDVSGDTMSIALWVLFDTTPSDPRLIMKGVGTASGDHYWGMNLNGGTDQPQFRIYASGSLTSLTATTALNMGEWYHIGGTYDGSNMRIYVNGVEENSTGKSGNVRTGAIDIWLGDQPGDPTARPHDGRLDDVRVYDRVLTPEEMGSIYIARGVDGITEGGISRYPMKEGAPGAVVTSIKDVWGGNDGTPTGTPTYVKGTTRTTRRVA